MRGHVPGDADPAYGAEASVADRADGSRVAAGATGAFGAHLRSARDLDAFVPVDLSVGHRVVGSISAARFLATGRPGCLGEFAWAFRAGAGRSGIWAD